MSGEEIKEDLIEEEIPEDQVEEGQEESVAEPVDPKDAEEARKYGWRPKEEFDRDPKGWVDAKRFLELPSTEVKRLRDENKRKDEDYEARFKRLDESNKAAMQRAIELQKAEYQREMEALRIKQREAVENADPEAFDALEAQRAKLRPPQETVEQGPPPELEAYRNSDKGKWLNDPILRDMGARAIHLAGMDSAPVAKQIEYAEQQVRQYFPHIFQAPDPAPQRSKVDGGGMGAAPNRKGVTALPAEARAAAKEFVEMGLYKSMDEYAADYWKQEGGK